MSMECYQIVIILDFCTVTATGKPIYRHNSTQKIVRENIYINTNHIATSPNLLCKVADASSGRGFE